MLDDGKAVAQRKLRCDLIVALDSQRKRKLEEQGYQAVTTAINNVIAAVDEVGVSYIANMRQLRDESESREYIDYILGDDDLGTALIAMGQKALAKTNRPLNWKEVAQYIAETGKGAAMRRYPQVNSILH